MKLTEEFIYKMTKMVLKTCVLFLIIVLFVILAVIILTLR